MVQTPGPNNPYDQLKAEIYGQLQDNQIDDKVFTVVQKAYEDVLSSQNIVLSRTEKKRLLHDVLKDVLTEMLAKI